MCNSLTVEVFDSKPYCRIVIAASFGTIHTEELAGGISIETLDTRDESEQNGGRAGRKAGSPARSM
ncbi:hypothetical protein GYMLUDRAFT_76025 [Collybiopsis luxurians FD-317 M1]|uniref:Uncharacterized protein n=1 Tax=Collybiopsis luxurians FD-317 M1 TaxID=944289 RepID=A0A0D0BNT1_9AGAR|nr:hypothetical protein GYMLUDRAFT_76025 [Collybiopsis luxurians FD-317 M1]